ncbi:hypothetical protein H6802_00240 [Candidatus Nomurabacteria bacterium]|uniref:Uncharacterized protein n=1 Tax=candidate division WWE3 bacterium TaxID=2053526 RepID=A0A955IVN2_UNCKA|nr:hypothetical protein [candidate division WWE3 bacterium]MCB9823381.1 hypothetical protein [Candidatus Nomurabacteria bacterium]MCB9826726.1 hypothetical protein [Candidatus Nomurabacteria bacterium]MCB9827663.1 hypothetical protein [Candidatus Nomurabacteria bacterium]HXK52542.1 hypothetical protein [bacterium]
MKKIILVGAVLVAVSFGLIVLSKTSQTPKNNTSVTIEEQQLGSQKYVAKRPMDGQDSFGLSVCEEVPSELVSDIIGIPIQEVSDSSTSTGTGCTYFTNKARYEHILVQVSYLSADTQKEGHKIAGRSIETDSSIPMEHFIAMQDDGNINAIYLVMTPNKFVRVDRTPNTADNEQLKELARKVAIIILGE